jgi:protocatechuate 3,4-dioxygenase beta subunit
VLTREGEGFAGLDLVAQSELSRNSNCSATSDEDGAFRFEIAEGLYTIYVCSAGHEVAPLEHVQAGSMNLVLTLVESARVRGKVIDPAGRPVEECLVEAVSDEVSTFLGSVVARKTVHHSSAGTFELGGLPEGLLAVVVRADGFAPTTSEPFRTERASTTKDVVVRMTEGGSISGLVLDAESGSPISGAEVFPLEHFWFTVGTGAGSERVRVQQWEVPVPLERQVARTNLAGRFVLDHMSAGPHRLRIQAAGFAAAVTGEMSVDERRTTEVRPQALVRGATITGVVYLDGRIDEGASVQLSAIDPDHTVDVRTARADAAGRFTFECVSPSNYRLSAVRANPGSDPFVAIGDVRLSEIEIQVADGSRHALELNIGGSHR